MRSEPRMNPADLPRGTMFVMYDPMKPVGRHGVYWRKRPYAVCFRGKKTMFSTYGISYHATPEKALAAARRFANENGYTPPPSHIY